MHETHVRFPGLPRRSGPPTRPRGRYCLATPEVNGPFRNGGIGTAYTSLAESLALAGHDVTLLFLRGDYCEIGTMTEWVEHYASKGVRLVPLPSLESVRLHGPDEAALSYSAFSWLREQERFDVVHFPELSGAGFYSLLAKRQGIAFPDTTFCIGTHSPILWIRESNAEYLHGVADLTMDALERQCVALADVVVSPSHYMLDWMTEQGWALPSDAFVQQNLLPSSARGEGPSDTTPVPVDELVFFGRLETRKGLELFVEAVSRLERPGREPLRVTFLGRPAQVRGRDSEDYLAASTRGWPSHVETYVATEMGQSEAMDYLRQPGRLAIIPSFVENSPYTVLECLGAGIPFLAAGVGGIGELIAPEDRDRVTFDPTPDALEASIGEALDRGARAAQPAVPFGDNENRWVAWHELVTTTRASSHDGARALHAAEERRQPAVRVCVTYGTSDAELAGCLAALRSQEYANYEIVLAPEVDTLGATRNRAAADSEDAFLFFTSSDQRSHPRALETYVAVALATGADLVTSLADARHAGAAEGVPRDRVLYLGGAPATGAFENAFGETHVLIRREAFERLGGFSVDARDGAGVWELYARAALAGCGVQVIPEALYEFTVDPEALLDERTHLRSLTPYLEAVRPELRGFLRYTQSLHLRRDDPGAEPTGDSEEEASQARDKAKCLVEALSALAEDGESDSAKGVVVAGVELLEPLGDPRALLDFLLGAARCLDRLGDATGALDLLAAAIRVGSNAPAQTFHHALLDAGRHLVRLGEVDAARDTLGSACQLAARNGLGAEHVASKIASGWAAGSAGAIDDARRALQEALAEAKALENGERGAELHLEAGERLADLGIQDVAWDAFRTAGQLAWQSGNRALIASAQRGMHRVARSDAPVELVRGTS